MKSLFFKAIICFFEVRIFGSIGQLAVQAVQFWVVFGKQIAMRILGSNFLAGQGM